MAAAEAQLDIGAFRALCSTLRECEEDEGAVQAHDAAVKTHLKAIQAIIQQASSEAPPPGLEGKIDQVLDAVLGTGVLHVWFRYLPHYELIVKKNLASLVQFLLHRRREDTVAYLKAEENRPLWHYLIVSHYAVDSETAMTCGVIVQECIRHKDLTKVIFKTAELREAWFTLVEHDEFPVASDAFATFKMLLTRQKTYVAKWLFKHHETFFEKYNQLFDSDNYITQRQSLKLLGELLMERTNFKVMMTYLSTPAYLSLIMDTMLEGSPQSVQVEAFHVFKLFVANPKKTPEIAEILNKARDDIVEFLTDFRPRRGAQQFDEEKTVTMDTLQSLQ